MSESWPDATIEQVTRESPNAARLAELASVAVQLDASLLRRLRHDLIPDTDPSSEADLWFGPLVEAQDHEGCVLHQAVRVRLQSRLSRPERRALLAAVGDVMRDAHRHLPAAVQLEEHLTLLALSRPDDLETQVQRELEPVLLALSGEDEMLALEAARWAMHAVPRLSACLGSAAPIQTLALAAALRLSEPRIARDVREPGLSADQLASFVPPSALQERVTLEVSLFAEGLRFGPPQGGQTIALPNTHPLLASLHWETAGTGGHAIGHQVGHSVGHRIGHSIGSASKRVPRQRLINIRVGELVSLSPTPKRLEIVTLAGDVYVLSKPEQATHAWQTYPERFAGEREQEAAAREILAGGTGSSSVSQAPPGDDSVHKAMDALRQGLQAEEARGHVPSERVRRLDALLQQFSVALSKADDIGSVSESLAAMKANTDQAVGFATDARFGGQIKVGTRAEHLTGLLSNVKRFLLQCATRRIGPPMIRLLERLTELEKQLRSEDVSIQAVERDSWRLAGEAHTLARSSHLALATPLWENRPIRHAPQSVFVSGGAVSKLLEQVADERRWTLLDEPRGGNYETERWNQLRGASVGVFCLPHVNDGEDHDGHSMATIGPRRQRAQICYEMGMALSLGLPIVVVLPPNTPVPFDVPVQTLRLANGPDDPSRLARAIEGAVFSLMWGGSGKLYAPPAAYEHARRRFNADALSGEASIAWRLVSESAEDPFVFSASLERFLEMNSKESLQLLSPAWAPRMPMPRRCFHITADRKWSKQAKAATAHACARHQLEYRHGGDSDEQRILDAIWPDLTAASCVLADLTDHNPNAALELGIAHTLGKPTRVLFNGDPQQVFFSLRRIRVTRYTDDTLEDCIEKSIAELAMAH